MFEASPGKATVPDAWKQINGGPYVQGPDGLWWYVSPFNPEPWKAFQATAITHLPEGFEEIFGPEPKALEFPSSRLFQVAHDYWEQNLKYFKRAGIPEWAERSQIEAANRVYVFWEMGDLLLFEGRYGWAARFTRAKPYEFAAETAIRFPHLVVAICQVSEIQEGRMPSKRHPFVPPEAWPDYRPDPNAHAAR